jgi:hypothetical protein
MSSKNLIKPIVDSLLQFESKEEEEEQSGIQTKAFLQSCRLFLPVLDALGVAFKPAKSDVSGNVERLAKKEGEHKNVSGSFISRLLVFYGQTARFVRFRVYANAFLSEGILD